MYRPVPSIGSKSCLWVVGWMYQVDVYLRVRRAVMVDGMSIREVSRVFGLHRDTVRKILAYSVPPGYRRQTPPRRPNPSTSSGVPYSTRPSGSLCRATYSDHEGLDFHWNRHAAVHWNRPPNSVDLEQREGHAHRYHGRAVLKNIARKVGERDKAKAKAVLSRAEPRVAPDNGHQESPAAAAHPDCRRSIPQGEDQGRWMAIGRPQRQLGTRRIRLLIIDCDS